MEDKAYSLQGMREAQRNWMCGRTQEKSLLHMFKGDLENTLSEQSRNPEYIS